MNLTDREELQHRVAEAALCGRWVVAHVRLMGLLQSWQADRRLLEDLSFFGGVGRLLFWVGGGEPLCEISLLGRGQKLLEKFPKIAPSTSQGFSTLCSLVTLVTLVCFMVAQYGPESEHLTSGRQKLSYSGVSLQY